ncbi:5'-methylthioadenosine/S-adenosylhomocysteine nucleosidase [Jeongeupia chitinilytica]|uniref:MTA/SAH nucleosidase n=1 Tax=Jeongeupia chitinilytica TaxID=1041641 RepID=A0ABQ3H2Y0_9NEIS|nr:5'-methylthioadenosine/S-adenosylhomocysteine nucleosidase [Jeongeupia chitinilytica]GHD64614.1 MTA/SAH nucleosidase [Jeongeupia chitinilytica]
MNKPIVIQGAMQVEIASLVAQLDEVVVETAGGWTFWSGLLGGVPVVISRTGMGMSNAAAATALAIERYAPAAVINQGTAGGHDPALQPNDLVLGTRVIHLGAFQSPFRDAGAGSDTLAWRPLDLMDQSESAEFTMPVPMSFDADPALLALAREVGYRAGRVVDGVIGSSDVWNNELDRIAHFHARYGTLVEEMEAASVALVCGQYGLPFLGVRVVSNNIVNGAAHDVSTANACQAFVTALLSRYQSPVAALLRPPLSAEEQA